MFPGMFNVSLHNFVRTKHQIAGHRLEPLGVFTIRKQMNEVPGDAAQLSYQVSISVLPAGGLA
jgi:hypothetical protein